MGILSAGGGQYGARLRILLAFFTGLFIQSYAFRRVSFRCSNRLDISMAVSPVSQATCIIPVADWSPEPPDRCIKGVFLHPGAAVRHDRPVLGDWDNDPYRLGFLYASTRLDGPEDFDPRPADPGNLQSTAPSV